MKKNSPDDFDASISGKSSEHFGWDWPEKDSPEVAREVVSNPLVYEDVVEEVMEMANDQDEVLSDQEVADDSSDDEHIEEKRPSKKIRVVQEEIVKDERAKKG
nr:hypothetical protein [Tanacetum cinerariifolium]